MINNFQHIYGVINDCLSAQKTFKQLRQINLAAKYTAQFKFYVDHISYNDIALMDQFYNGFKLDLRKKLAKMLNNIFSNNFFSLVNLKQNIIKMDQCFWDLNTNFQDRYIISTHGHYMHMGSYNPVNYGKLMEDVQYNNMQKKNYTTTILKDQLFIIDVVMQNTFEEIIWF